MSKKSGDAHEEMISMGTQEGLVEGVAGVLILKIRLGLCGQETLLHPMSSLTAWMAPALPVGE